MYGGPFLKTELRRYNRLDEHTMGSFCRLIGS